MNGTQLDEPAPTADNSEVQSCGGHAGSRPCEFYRAQNPQGGVCVRFPPTPVVLMVPEQLSAQAILARQQPRPVPQLQGFNPPVASAGWCGEWSDGAADAEAE
jgi:hypothetical protein